jgi:hypothetical protein
MVVVGDGRPISFQILDSAFNLSQGRIVPRYEDNSGSLTVVIEERPLFNLCGIERSCADGSTRLAIAASLLSYDDTTGRPENILRDPSQILVTIDGTSVPVDSVACAHRAPVAYALVLDRSGSMDFAYDGSITRMEALKSAALGFLRSLRPGDEAELISFSFDDDITLDVGWTSDTAALARGIRALNALGGTAWRDAAWLGIGEAARHYNPIRAVVLLTDGDDTHSQLSLAEVTTSAQQLNVPVYAIGVALVDSSERPLRYLAGRSNGRFFQARDQRQMDSVFGNLSRAVASDECCTLYVTVPRAISDTAGTYQLELSARDSVGDVLLRSEAIFLDDSCSGVTRVEEMLGSKGAGALTAWPNPARGTATAQIDLREAGRFVLEVVDAAGRAVPVIAPVDLLAGPKRFALDLDGIAPGAYLLRATLDGRSVGASRLVVVN